MEKEIENKDTICKEHIICPYCGYDHGYLYLVEDGRWLKNNKCDECGNIFDVYIEYRVEYSTYKKEEE